MLELRFSKIGSLMLIATLSNVIRLSLMSGNSTANYILAATLFLGVFLGGLLPTPYAYPRIMNIFRIHAPFVVMKMSLPLFFGIIFCLTSATIYRFGMEYDGSWYPIKFDVLLVMLLIVAIDSIGSFISPFYRTVRTAEPDFDKEYGFREKCSEWNNFVMGSPIFRKIVIRLPNVLSEETVKFLENISCIYTLECGDFGKYGLLTMVLDKCDTSLNGISISTSYLKRPPIVPNSGPPLDMKVINGWISENFVIPSFISELFTNMVTILTVICRARYTSSSYKDGTLEINFENNDNLISIKLRKTS